MQSSETGSLPPFPTPPPDRARREHLPTVEASIRYWDAVRVLALAEGDAARARTAAALSLTYEEARRELKRRRDTHPRPGD